MFFLLNVQLNNTWQQLKQYYTVPGTHNWFMPTCHRRPSQASVGKTLRGEFRDHGSARKGHLHSMPI